MLLRAGPNSLRTTIAGTYASPYAAGGRYMPDAAALLQLGLGQCGTIIGVPTDWEYEARFQLGGICSGSGMSYGGSTSLPDDTIGPKRYSLLRTTSDGTPVVHGHHVKGVPVARRERVLGARVVAGKTYSAEVTSMRSQSSLPPRDALAGVDGDAVVVDRAVGMPIHAKVTRSPVSLLSAAPAVIATVGATFSGATIRSGPSHPARGRDARVARRTEVE